MKKRIVLLLLVLLALVTIVGFSGCSKDDKAAASDSATEQKASAAETGYTEEEIAANLSLHEVYKYLDDTAFGGVTLPVIQDRSGIEKNLPVEKKSKVTIGWACPSMGSSYFAGIKIGAEAQSKKYGYDLKFLIADNFNATKMSADIESLVTQKVDILVVDPCDTQANLIDVKRAVKAGIPVVASGVPFDQSAPVITTVVSNNYEGGFQTAKYAAQKYTDDVKVIIIPGMLGHPVSNSRVNGWMAGWVYGKQIQAGTAKDYREDAMLEGYRYYKELVEKGKVDMSKYGAMIGGSANGGFNEVDGMAAAEDLLTANGDTTVIFAENDHMGIGAAKVLSQRGLSGKVQIYTAADGDKKALEMVRDGELATTGYNNPVVIAKRVIDLIHMMYAEGYDANNMPIITQLPVEVIDSSKAANYIVSNSEYAKELDVPFYTIEERNAE